MSGGWQNEAVEVGLQYANQIKNLDEIIVIGDARGNIPQEIPAKRRRYQNYEQERMAKGMLPTTS